MENHYFDSLIAEMQGLFSEQGFKETAAGEYKNDKKAIKIEYDEKAQMYRLFMADIKEEGEIEYTEVSAWLFDDSQNEKDAASVGMDFCETAREKMGVKIVQQTNAQIDLPTFTKDGAYNVTAFAKKVLDVFPALKDNYRDHIAKYGNFLYIEFFGEFLVPEIKNIYRENNKKSVKKVTEMAQNAYVNGDKEVVDILVAVLAAAVCDDETAKANLVAALGDNTHFIQAVTNFIPSLQKSKKLKSSLLK